MRTRSLFSARLYNQIVYPLLAASIVVGIIATIVAVYFLEELTNEWVMSHAANSTENLAHRYRSHAEQMLREARFAADEGELTEAMLAGDFDAAQRQIEQQNRSLGFDLIMVRDSTGSPIARTGPLAAAIDPAALPPVTAKTQARPRAAVVPYSAGHALVVGYPVTGAEARLLLGEKLDHGFLQSLGVAEGTAYALYDSSRRRIALTVGGGFDKVSSARIAASLNEPDPTVRHVLEETDTHRPGHGSIRLGHVPYQVWASRVNLPGSVDAASTGYLVGIVSQRVSEQTVRTTRNLIAMWSVVAVVALVGLGGWIARRVSDPLIELAGAARRLADGDFNTRLEVAGSNEVAELTTTFNDMTCSLKERSDSLTKKVLELATLYEMSRSLGSTLDMDELLGSVLESALRIFDLDLGYMVLRDRDSGDLSIRALRGDPDKRANGALSSSMSEWVVREGRPLIFNPNPGAEREQVDSVTGARAALCVPLVSNEGAIGSITIGSSRNDYRFSSDDVRLLSTIANHVTIAVGNIELFSSLQEAYLATVKSLAAAVDAKDTYTRGHSDRVATYATLTAERMGLSHEQRVALEMAAYLHDIGKIGVPGDILLKPGRLDDNEMAQMRHHPLIGANILKPVAFPWAITPVVRHHHEAYDGSGYPAGLKGEEIPLLARILTVADSFEAMTADRPYRRGRSVAEAVEELEACAGGQFDPRIVSIFVEVVSGLDEAEIGVPAIVSDEIAPEEARAIFAALVDGLFASFRRLGGPRLAANIESEADAFFEAEQMPFRIVRGRVSFLDDAPAVLDGELSTMRAALKRIDGAMGSVSGPALVEHFYADALDGLSMRMRHLAHDLEFVDGE